MPGWTLSRNASSEVMRALEIKALGVAKVQDLKPTLPEKKLEVPPGLELNDISPAILDVTKGANDLRWTLKSDQSAALEFDQMKSELGSNNWVVDGTKSTTGGPILAHDPHREVVHPALRYVVHLNAPGWNALGGTEPGLPGISIGHNERIAWGFTILGIVQQDLYVVDTDPQNPNRYRYKGQWEEMTVERSEEHTSELQSRQYLVCRLLLEKKNDETPQSVSLEREAAAPASVSRDRVS